MPRRSPRVLVLRAPGTNCERETAFAFATAGAEPVTLHVNALFAAPRRLESVEGLVLPGGFSFGDDLGAGTAYAALLRTRVVDRVRRLVDRGGVVLGICNGFQALVKTGLLPAMEGSSGQDTGQTVALAANVSNRYEDRWVSLVATADCAFFSRGDRLACPVAHGEGRFLAQDLATLDALRAAGQLALRYVDPDGHLPARYPHNPNGSSEDVAGLIDPTGRILGLMPHPERHQFPWQSPRFHADGPARRPDGMLPFVNAVRHLRSAFDLAPARS